MQKVSIDCVDALAGEESFIFQLRPPHQNHATDNALAEHIDLYVGMALAASALDDARYAQLGPMTWSIVCHRFSADEVVDVIDEIIAVLFPDSEEPCVEVQRQINNSEEQWALPEPSAAMQAAFSDENEFDLDAAMNDPVEPEQDTGFAVAPNFDFDHEDALYVDIPQTFADRAEGNEADAADEATEDSDDPLLIEESLLYSASSSENASEASDALDDEAEGETPTVVDAINLDEFGPSSLGRLPRTL